MPRHFHGHSCTLVLFEEPAGQIKSLYILEGILDVAADGTVSLVHEGSKLPIPPHLAEFIEEVTDEHRACMEDLTSTYCLRASYDGRLGKKSVDLAAVLTQCSGPPTDA